MTTGRQQLLEEFECELRNWIKLDRQIKDLTGARDDLGKRIHELQKDADLKGSYLVDDDHSRHFIVDLGDYDLIEWRQISKPTEDL